MAGGLRNALFGVPFVVVIRLVVLAASPFLATCGGHEAGRAHADHLGAAPAFEIVVGL